MRVCMIDDEAVAGSSPSATGDAADVGPHVDQARGLEADDLDRVASAAQVAASTSLEADRAHVAEVLRDDDVGCESRRASTVDVVDRRRRRRTISCTERSIAALVPSP